MNPEQWGWKVTKNCLTPVTSLQPIAPDKLLKLIACKCKKNCMGNCGCRRAGLFCTAICFVCEGKCSISDALFWEDEEDFEDEFAQIVPEADQTEGRSQHISYFCIFVYNYTI